ncbi:hypothetical protein [Metabacillus sediminilitoris]|nr:hypothetical protein [Metabacillus sediminilitoris]QGQ45286.1 hypothetical protein GMB29_08470 [Metabacillus sediminilitoris]
MAFFVNVASNKFEQLLIVVDMQTPETARGKRVPATEINPSYSCKHN